MASHGATVAFLWSVPDFLRDHFKRTKYPDVILPFTVPRRIDAVFEPTKAVALRNKPKDATTCGFSS